MKIKVKKGQVWADNDKRSKGRTMEVIDIVQQRKGWGVIRQEGRKYARCKILTRIGGGPLMPSDKRETHIRLDRMRPTSTGYRLVRDVCEEVE